MRRRPWPSPIASWSWSMAASRGAIGRTSCWRGRVGSQPGRESRNRGALTSPSAAGPGVATSRALAPQPVDQRLGNRASFRQKRGRTSLVARSIRLEPLPQIPGQGGVGLAAVMQRPGPIARHADVDSCDPFSTFKWGAGKHDGDAMSLRRGSLGIRAAETPRIGTDRRALHDRCHAQSTLRVVRRPLTDRAPGRE